MKPYNYKDALNIPNQIPVPNESKGPENIRKYIAIRRSLLTINKSNYCPNYNEQLLAQRAIISTDLDISSKGKKDSMPKRRTASIEMDPSMFDSVKNLNKIPELKPSIVNIEVRLLVR